MHILVLIKMVPDVVEELEIAPDRKTLDSDLLRTIVSESDDHALEQALLLKERYGGTLTALALDAPEVDDALFTALAKGADRAVKIAAGDGPHTTREAARAVVEVLRSGAGLLPADLLLTGVQAIDDLDGLVAPLIARELEMPYVGIVTGVTLDRDLRVATVVKEYPGGVRGEFEIDLPAVLAIQAAEKPPRYVPVARLRAVMKTRQIKRVVLNPPETGDPLFEVLAMRKPEPAAHAEMLEGSTEAVSCTLCAILAARGLL